MFHPARYRGLTAIVVALAMVPAAGHAQAPPEPTPETQEPVGSDVAPAESDVPASPAARPPAPQPPAPAPASATNGASWGGKLSVQRCPFAAPVLPAQTELALNATLIVRVPDGVGSAVLISPDGFALTAAHVVENHQTVGLVTRAGATLSATVVRVDEAQDVALLKMETQPGATPCLAPAVGQVPLGSDVFVLGSPAGEELSFSVAKGIISGYRSLGGLQFVQFDAAVNPGNSGGPAVDQAGQIVGITSWKLSDVSLEGLSFAVPCDVALSALDVELGDASSPDWNTHTGRRSLAPKATPGGAPTHVDHASPADPQQRKRLRVKRGLITAGILGMSVGVVSVAATGGVYYITKISGETTQSSWSALVAVNTIGWALAGVGAGALIVGIALPKRVKKSGAAARLEIMPNPTGAMLQGSF
ncbi:S1C family serine protease [Enhygromyxa salina]|uniref:S1C family serine protease n=1 Tax=Enhygromyxa salina TaxID=215803 RepID=UPI0011B23B39|nr:trypsin-like peptidase domain-containing protein [Enhygromyxa salina]